ncbi:MAG: sulfurtransferase [Gammaproteobacteria bacterium]|jgi:rhodanese-related sulfurtransferase|nr:sulfurtransferase [Gammaproteobacteria bacterium]MDG2106728.1 rhodanese-like domain-containing protein [Gammaproteobacteria bacterium]|tara:strand:- start:14141 stop:14464 length:324 start_codon:yes stop_codon:yes gene_type:complete
MIEKSVLEISEILNDSSIIPVILDVREKWEYDICHIENSVHIPMGQITERKDDLNNNDMIIVVCHHGIRSRMVAKYLDANGFTNVINLSGGVDAWSNEVDPSMTKYV